MEAEILSREDLDVTNLYGTLNLPDPGPCPYAETAHFEGYRSHVYLGNYNGWDAFLVHTVMEGYGVCVIGGSSFLWFEYAVVLCQGDETVLLNRAFERNIVTYEDVRKMAYYCYGEIGPSEDAILFPILINSDSGCCQWSELTSE